MNILEQTLNSYKELEGLPIDWKNQKTLWGVSPVAPIHLGYDQLILLQKQAIKLGVKRHFLIIADLHGLMTHKLSWHEIRKRSFYYEFYFREICEMENTDVILGSYFQTNPNYIEELYSALREISLRKTRDTMPSSKDNETVFSYVAVYSIMQCLDVLHTGANLILGGVDQKKIYSLMKSVAHIKVQRAGKEEYFSSLTGELNFLYLAMSYGILGERLISSKSKTRITIHETKQTLAKKIQQMYAPEGRNLELGKANSLLETFKHSVFPWIDGIQIKNRDGVVKEYNLYEDFETDYFDELISSQAAKETLNEKLFQRLTNIQEKLLKGIVNWVDVNKATGYESK